jgi:hypothetical protein
MLNNATSVLAYHGFLAWVFVDIGAAPVPDQWMVAAYGGAKGRDIGGALIAL